MKYAKMIVGAAMMAQALAPQALAWGPFGRRHRAHPMAPVAWTPAPAVAYATPQAPAVAMPAPAPAPATPGDASGFLAWLNATRAGCGLAPVAYDASLESDCHANNAAQAAMGLGHHHMGRARRQNSAMGLGFPGVESAWLGSPGHCAALLDPTIRWVAIAWHGAWCTFAAY